MLLIEIDNEVECWPYLTHCSRIDRYPNFIALDFSHFSWLIPNGDNQNMKENFNFDGEFLKNFKICI